MCSLLMSSFCLIANLAEAKNLIGMDYVRVISGASWPDDGSKHSYQAGMTYNRNLNDHTDVQVDLHTAWNDEPSSDDEINHLSTGLVWYKSCEQMGYTFVSADLIFQETDRAGLPSRTDVGAGIGLGMEKMINDCVLSRAAANYSYVNNPYVDEDKFSVDVEVGYWINDKVLAGVGAAYNFTADSALASLGITVQL